MENKKQEYLSINEIEAEIKRVRLENIMREKELCYLLAEKAKLENDHYALAFSYTFLGDYYLAMRDNTSAIHHLRLAQRFSERSGYDDLLIHIYNFLGLFYYSIYDEVTSLDFHLKSLHYAKKEHNLISIASSYSNMATCFELKNDYKEAMRYYQLSYDIIIQLDDEYQLFKLLSLVNLCSCSYHLNKLDQITAYLTQIKDLCLDDKNPVYLFLNSYCVLLSHRNDTDPTLLYQIADIFFEAETKVTDPLLVYQIMLNVCELFLDLKHQQYAEKSIKVMDHANHDKDLKSQKEIQKFIIRYHQLFETDESLAKEYAQFYDIIMAIENMEQKTRVAGLLAKIELYATKEKQVCMEKEKQQMEQLMNTDDLTGIHNRRCFNHMLEYLKTAPCSTIGIAMLDLDYFKEYNDYYGHQKGDDALIEVGASLKEFSSDDIQVYRYGGDEFSIIFSNQQEAKIKDLLTQLSAYITRKNIPHRGSHVSDILSISYGFAWSSKKHEDLDLLLQQADKQLYIAKNQRKERNQATEKKAHFTE